MGSHNLPAALTSFIGRAEEIGTLVQVLLEHRLVTITGPGGCGKTRLALELARHLVSEFEDGVWFIELASVNDVALVTQAVATTLKVREEPGKPLTQTLANHLSSHSCLLVLDNCEHLVASCAELSSYLLTCCPHTRILVTSRQVLGIRGEVTWRTAPLSVPAPNTPLLASQLQDFEATRLFLDRARSLIPGYQPGEKSASTIAHLCRRLDGMPLAIELAVSRIQVLSADQILSRIENQSSLLAHKERGGGTGSRTLSETLDWSYGLLTEREQALWRRLAVFVGGFTLEAVEQTCSGEDVSAPEILDLLSDLVDKSMVVSDQHDTGPRFWLLETMRHYGQEKLVEAGEESTWRVRHLIWCLELVEQLTPNVNVNKEALQSLTEEIGNIRAALSWCKTTQDVERGLRLATALGPYWEVVGYNTEGRDHLNELLHLEGAAQHMPLLASAFGIAGDLARHQSDFAEATALYEKALAIYRSLQDQRGTAASYHRLAMTAYLLDNWILAESLHEQSLAIYKALGEYRRASGVLLALANVSRNRGDYTKAQECYQEHLSLCSTLNDKRGMAYAMGSLGLTSEKLGDVHGAVAWYEKSLDLLIEIGDKSGISKALMNLANALVDMGVYARAEDLFQQSLGLYRELGNKLDIAGCLFNMGRLSNLLTDYRRAMALLKESAKLAKPLGVNLLLVFIMEEFAVLHHAEGRHARSVRLLGAADEGRRSIGSPYPPSHRAALEQLTMELRASLGEERWKAAWEEGKQTPLEAAIDYACQDFAAAHESEGVNLSVITEGRGKAGLQSGAQIKAQRRSPEGILTKRETEITCLVAKGLSDREVAARLVISVRTVDTHLRNIFTKVEVSSRTGLVVWAVRNGFADDQ